jgi:hypothetical protein
MSSLLEYWEKGLENKGKKKRKGREGKGLDRIGTVRVYI